MATDTTYSLNQPHAPARQTLADLAPGLLVAAGAPTTTAWEVASTIFAALRPLCAEPRDATALLLGAGPALDELLAAVEAQAGASGLARHVRLHLERLALEHGEPAGALALGLIHVAPIEISAPIADVRTGAQAERLWGVVLVEGERLGRVELPVCDGLVPGDVIADAIAGAFAWAILGRFFARTLYPSLGVEREAAGATVRRGKLVLAKGMELLAGDPWPAAHDAIGWVALMQELWGRPDWPDERFYDRKARDGAQAPRRPRGGWLFAEASAELPELLAGDQPTDVVLAVGGVPVGSVRVPGGPAVFRAQELRVRLIEAAGMELCVAAVREGILGRPLAAEPAGLRSRLAAQAARTPADARDGLAPGSAAAVARALGANGSGAVIGRRAGEPLGSRAPRRVALPAAALGVLAEAAARYGSPLVRAEPAGAQPARAIFAPDLIGPARPAAPAAASATAPAATPGKAKTAYDRNHFEVLFAAHPDPWKYTSPYEQIKYEQTLALIPPGRVGRALEIACAEGHFTAQLAPRVERLVATDISQIALERTAARCAGHGHIEYQQLDLVKDALPGRFDLIVCSEMLYFVGGRAELARAARAIADALNPGGHLVSAHMNLVVDEPDRPGYDWDLPFGAKTIGETFARSGQLELVRELHTPLYRVQLFRRRAGLPLPWRRANPQIERMEQPAPPPAQVADHVLWQGGAPRGAGQPSIETRHLPILMYHRVAPAGAAAAARYRVTPERFAEQLRYLRDAGFYSVGLEEWRAAMETRRPLPGRAVLITFDDGYQDFQEHAWPLLKQFGFGAHMFLVADQIGGVNAWDAKFGERVPLLGWPAIHELVREGVAIGAHTCTHRPLNALAPAEVVEEGLRSRMALEQELGRPITSIAYPYGDADGAVQHLMGACGFTSGLTCRPGRALMHDAPLALPRIDVDGTADLAAFIAQIGR